MSSSPAALTVRVPGLLRSYTDGIAEVRIDLAEGLSATVGDALGAMNARYAGLRFRIVDEQWRIRPHIKLFLDTSLVRTLDTPLAGARELLIVGALSGG